MNGHTQLVFALLLIGAGCNKVEIKKDTPTATVATIVKLFGAADDTHWAEVVDPVVARASARGEACLSEVIKDGECIKAETAYINGDHFAKFPSYCPTVITDCTCGARGTDAAAKASNFMATGFYVALKMGKLSPESCRITNTAALTENTLQDLGPTFRQNACSDVGKDDELASVTLICVGGEEPLTFILRKKNQKWAVAGFSLKTEAALDIAAMAASVARQHAEDFNKDMK